MTLDEAIAEVRRVTPGKVTWNELDFDMVVAPVDASIATILNAVVSCDLIPLSDHRLAVALAYQRAGDAYADGASPDAGWDFFGAAYDAILALADGDPLAEVQALKAELAEARMKSLADLGQAQEAWEAQRVAEAEVARLREALNHIDALDPEESVSGISADAARGLVNRMGSIARAALQPKAAP